MTKLEKLRTDNDKLLRKAQREKLIRNEPSYRSLREIIEDAKTLKLNNIKNILEESIKNKEKITADILKKKLAKLNKPVPEKLIGSYAFGSRAEGYKVLKDILKLNLENYNIILDIYGTYLVEKSGYYPDNLFKKFYRHSLNGSVLQYDDIHGFERSFARLIYEITGITTLDDVVTGKFRVIKRAKPKQHQHRLLLGESHCFFVPMRENCKNSEILNKITHLEEKYKIGVMFKDIPSICDYMYCNVQIYSLVGEKIYEYYYPNHSEARKTYKFVINKIDHVEQYFEQLHDMSKKEIVYVDNVEEAYENNLFNSIVQVVKRGFEKEVLYYYDEFKIYKNKEWEGNDEGQYFICDEFTKEKHNFEKEHNLIQFNRLYKSQPVFDFSMRSNHYINEFYFEENIDKAFITWEQDDLDNNLGVYKKKIDLKHYFAYDMNKNFASYKKCQYYNKYKFPATAKFDFYKIEEEFDIDKLLDKTGFIQIDNLVFPDNNFGIILKKLGYFTNGYTYPTPSLKLAYDNGLRFNCKAIAFTNWTYDIEFSDTIIKNKYYNAITGMMKPSSESIQKKIRYHNLEMLQDLLFYHGDKITLHDSGELSYKIEIRNFSNQCHISSFILAYAFIQVMEKMKYIDPKDIIGVKVDCIITKKKYNHIFKLNRDILGDWKEEAKGEKDMWSDLFIINQKDIYNCENLIPLTEHKLNYKKINMITGPGGTGKTTRFVKKFETDERLSSLILTLPTNELKLKFIDDNDVEIVTSTYHSYFGIGSRPNYEQLRKYSNVVLDEATMLSMDSLKHILDICDQFKVNLFLVGDYNYEKKQIYQLKPVCGEPFLNYNFDMNVVYCVDLKYIYRSANDKKHILCTQQMRGKCNREALAIAKRSKIYKSITIGELPQHFDCKTDICLASTNKVRLYVNGEAVKQEDTEVNVKFGVTDDKKFSAKRKRSSYKFKGETYFNNQKIRINKEDFDSKQMEYAYCITNHLSQGLEWGKPSKIFIVVDNFFEDNMVYVCFSRAKESSQIILVYPDKEEMNRKTFDEIVLKKLKEHRDNDKKHGRQYDLDYNFVLELFKKYNGKCKYCGNTVMKENYPPHHHRQFSLDRVRNNLGHLKSNVVLSCLGCNTGQSRRGG